MNRSISLSCLLMTTAACSTATPQNEVSGSVASALQGCTNADPTGRLANVGGDFEIIVDPRDASHLIFATNRGQGFSSIVIAQVNAATGLLVDQPVTTVATDYNGQTYQNGPEFVQRPSSDIGLVYAGGGTTEATDSNPYTGTGVHVVYRTGSAWNSFPSPADAGALLGSSDAGHYPAAGMPLGQNTYGQFGPECTLNGAAAICYAFLDGSLDGGAGTYTNVYQLLYNSGLNVTASTQSPDDGTIFMAVCGIQHPNNCAIYSGDIDGYGGFVGGVTKVADLPSDISVPGETLRAIKHPVSNTVVVFAGRSVWEQTTHNGQLALVASNMGGSLAGDHYRTEADGTSVVLHYLVRNGTASEKGSYTVRVTATTSDAGVTTLHVPSSSKKISSAAGGAEIVYSSAANDGGGQWALYYKDKDTGVFTVCAVNP